MSTPAYIGLGSNLGDRLANLGDALRALDAVEGADVVRVSDVYESEPWGVSGQPPYANAVALVDTTLGADQLLGVLKDLEVAIGRTAGPRWGPRVIDLDILLFGDEEWQTADLVVPHPRLAERDFAVTPLLALEPDVRWPDGSPVTRDGVRVGRVTGKLGRVPGFQACGDVDHDEEWVAVYERPGYNPMFGLPSPLATGLGALSGRFVPGNVPSAEASFFELVLGQLGIPYAWDPFPPAESVDPYNLSRPFRLLVPASRAEEASAAIREAKDAPIEWEDMEP